MDPDARRKHDEWISRQEAKADRSRRPKSSKQEAAPRPKHPPELPRYLKALLSIHISISALAQTIVYRVKAGFRLAFHPLSFLVAFTVGSTYLFWSWSESGAINRFLDRFLDRKSDSIMVETRPQTSDPSLPPVSIVNLSMTALPGGEFLMGSNTGFEDELPIHTVTVSSFEISKYENTFDIWETCFAAGGCSNMPDDRDRGKGEMPIIDVSYDEIVEQFIPWLNSVTGGGYRLPTEAEWEYAAKAESNTEYGWGNDIGVGQANCSSDCEDSYRYSAAVGSFTPNAFGLYDMNGNVWEWVQDCASPNYNDTPVDGTAHQYDRCRRRTIRGGSWGADAANSRSTARSGMESSGKFQSLGFRLAQDLP